MTWPTCLKALGFTGLLASLSYICCADEMHSLQINGAVQRSFKVGVQFMSTQSDSLYYLNAILTARSLTLV